MTATNSAGEDVTLFTAVDRTADPNFFSRFLDAGNALPTLRASKPIMVEQLRLGGGERVLEAGCGTGADALELARLVGPNGRVVGVDVSEVMIGEARRRAVGSDLPVDFEVGDVQALRFEDERFDACRTERMLMHVPDAGQALSELVRVTRSGGRVVVFDMDSDTFFVDSDDRDVTRRMMRSFSDGIRNNWVGRQLPRWFAERDLTDVTVTPHTVLLNYEFCELLWGGHLTQAQRAGVVTAEETARWWAALRQAHEQGRFFAGLTAFVVAGTKR
jgi:ubiquinone/menaquinone biosynthesis C-methylase UbiE